MEIKNQYEHSKFGMFMFNLCANWTKFILKHKVLYYILSFTWGIIMTLIGSLVTAAIWIAKLFGLKAEIKKYYWGYDISVGPEYWGGCTLGIMFLRDWKSSIKYINDHEFGHTLQNCLLGPLFPLLVAIPSATRYWYQTIRENKGKDNVPYDSVWFEDAATQCGNYAVEFLSQK